MNPVGRESARNWRKKTIRDAMAAGGKQHVILRVPQMERCRNFDVRYQPALFEFECPGMVVAVDNRAIFAPLTGRKFVVNTTASPLSA